MTLESRIGSPYLNKLMEQYVGSMGGASVPTLIRMVKVQQKVSGSFLHSQPERLLFMVLLKDLTVFHTLSSIYVFPLGVFLFLLYRLICLSHQTILRTCEPKPEKLVRMHAFYPIQCSCIMQFLLRFPFRYVIQFI